MLKEMIVEKGKKYSVFVTPFAVFLCMVVMAYATCGMTTAPLTVALAGGLSAVNTTAAAVGGIIAYLASGEITQNAFIICGLILVTAGKWIMRDDTSPRTAAFITFVSMTFSGIVFGLVVMGDFKQAVLNVVYAVVSAVASYFISFTAEILKYPNQISADRQTLTAFAVVFVLVSALLDGISVSVFNVGIIISSVVLLCACRFFGCGGGVVCGVLTTAGVFIGQTELGLQTAFFGVAGLMAGFVSGYSRVTITAVFSGIILLGQLVTGINDISFCVQADIIIGSIIFMLIPERIVTMGGRLCSGAVKDSSELLAKEMKFAATSISDIRKSIMDIITVFDSKQKNVDFVEKVSSRICGKCRYKLDCWEKNFESTNAAFRKLESGKRGTFPLSFDCTGKNKIAEEFEKCRNEETVSKMLMARLNESRNFLFSQMEASADIVNSLSAKINVNVSKSMTSTLCRALEKYDVDFNSAIVYYTVENRLIAEIFLPEKTEYDIEEMCSVLSRELSAVLEYSQPFEASGEVRLRFNRKTKYTLDYAFSQLSAAENEPSGDTCGFFTDGLGFAYAFISDGMGNGNRAAVDSQLTAKLFKRLVRLGLSCEGAVKMINSVMMAKSGEESFATLDIAKINLETGGVTLCKSGASSTLIRYGSSVMMFSFSSNPVGIIHDAYSGKKECDFSEGNVLVMMSDGVPENSYLYIKEQLILDTPPKELTKKVCDYSRKITPENVYDDITVAAFRLVKNSKKRF